MLKDLDIGKIPIDLGGNKLYLRYNLNAMRYLEDYVPDFKSFLGKDSKDWTRDDVVHLLRAGLMDCFFDENEQAISDREFKKVKPSIAAIGRYIDDIGLTDIVISIIKAVTNSLPALQVGANPQKGGRR